VLRIKNRIVNVVNQLRDILTANVYLAKTNIDDYWEFKQ